MRPPRADTQGCVDAQSRKGKLVINSVLTWLQLIDGRAIESNPQECHPRSNLQGASEGDGVDPKMPLPPAHSARARR